MRFKAKLGEELPLDLQVLKARRGLLEEITRSYLVGAMALVAVSFLVGAAILELVDGSFEWLGAVWTALAVPLGAVVGHCLPGQRAQG
jgi:hypothetical protein